MAYSDFDKLKTFLTELKNVHYRLDLVRSRVQTGGRWATIDKKECLNLLREKIPELQGKDDAFLTKYLSDPRNVKNQLLGKFTAAERLELEQSLTEEVPQVPPPAEQPSGGEAAGEQIPPPAGQGMGPGIPGLPQTPSFSPSPRRIIIHDIPRSGMEGGSGAGTAATNKIDRVGAATTKGNRLTANAPSAEPSGLSVSSPARINFSALRSKVNRAAGGAIKSGLETANPYLGRAGHGLVNGLTGIANPRGIGGAGSRSMFGRFSRFGRGGGRAVSSFGKSVKDRKWLLYLIGILGMMFLTGFIAATSPQPSPSPSPRPSTAPTSDISQCKFTRGAETPPEAVFNSSTLLSYIQEASQKSTIPPVVLAAFIRVESPSTSNMPNEQIANYAATCAESPTGALGIMQIQPPGTTSLKGDPASCDDCIDAGARLVGKTVSTMTGDDYCDPRTSIIVGAGWILKKMQHLGLGDGTRWDPAWTNKREAIETLVHTYYGCPNFLYGGPTDCTGPFNYADDVWTSIQNCQTASTNCATPGACPLVSCPLSRDGSGSFNITCGTFNNPNSGSCGHGGSGYPTCVSPPYAVCPYSDQLKVAIDVKPAGSNGNNTPVYFPFINGQSVNWTLASGPITLNQGAWGVKVEYTAANAEGKQIRLDLSHLDQAINTGANKSGDQVGVTKAGVDTDGGHLHTAVSVNGAWIDAISEAKMCTP